MLKNKKYGELLQSYEVRRDNVINFIKSVNPSIECIVVPLDEPMGPTITDNSLELIVVSEETHNGAHEINKVRQQRAMKPLHIVVIRCVANQDGLNPNDSKLSSTSLREREWKLQQSSNLTPSPNKL